MAALLVEGDLAEPCQPIADFLPKQETAGLNVILESELGSWTKADRDLRIVRARKAPGRRRFEFARNHRFRDLSGTSCNRV
jgi:hypothetical protein